MTDLEISKALALTIGWTEDRMKVLPAQMLLLYPFGKGYYSQFFDYRDWNVIGPIAARYRCFPLGAGLQWASRTGTHVCMYADTPQKAIALAVIEGAKR